MDWKDPVSQGDSGSFKDAADHINVTIRIRPLNARELRTGGTLNAWSVQNDTITQLHYHTHGRSSIGNSFTFDHIFDPQRSTKEVFNAVAQDIIHSTMDGFNGTIFAYGQTSSGKTHTMYGIPEEPGIIDLSIRRIFERIEQTPDREYLLRVSFLEIYNEVIKDLLNPENHHLKIHEHATRGIFVGNLTENIVMSVHDVKLLLEQGDRNRHVGETNMNDRSSRSHTIVRMVIESRERSIDEKAVEGVAATTYSGAVKVSCLNLVDLAGSERVAHTGAEGARLREGAHINRSLLALGTVIAKLTENDGDRSNVHIPYRDSKLTRILEPSLGGNAKTAIVCTITPASTHVEETLSTLKFANRAKNVCNKPEINEELTGEALLRVYHKEISMLKKKLDEYRTMNGSLEIEKLTHQKMQIEEYNEEIRRQLREKEGEEARLKKHYEELKMMILDSTRLRNSDIPQARR
ncbi:P-loop containing nucleoside triphosphate hydrolase protein, partial [Dimargaris cristalligena]